MKYFKYIILVAMVAANIWMYCVAYKPISIISAIFCTIMLILTAVIDIKTQKMIKQLKDIENEHTPTN